MTIVMRWGLSVGLALSAIVVSSPARADEGFRCYRTNRLINVGDRLPEVRARCGAPDFADSRAEKRKVKLRVRRQDGVWQESLTEEEVVEVVIDEWTYDFGRRKFMRHLHFENGRLVSVATGSYGGRDDDDQ